MQGKYNVRTHIEVLDKLLGCDLNEQDFYIESGNIILLRGEPGSGKTTLGLQILSQYMKDYEAQQKNKDNCDTNNNSPKKSLNKTDTKPKEKNDDKEPKQKVVFFSLERDPLNVLKYAQQHYDFFESEDFSSKKSSSTQDLCIQYLNAENMRSILKEIAGEEDEMDELNHSAIKNVIVGSVTQNAEKIIGGCYDLGVSLGKSIINRLKKNVTVHRNNG